MVIVVFFFLLQHLLLCVLHIMPLMTSFFPLLVCVCERETVSLFLFLDNDSCQFCGCVNLQDMRAHTDRDGVSGSLRLCITNILLCMYCLQQWFLTLWSGTPKRSRDI